MAEEKKELTAEEWVKKLHEERKYWRGRLKKQEEETTAAVAQIRRICNTIIARMAKSHGRKEKDEYVLDILAPVEPEGKVWIVQAEKLKDGHTMRYHAKLVDIS